MKKHLGLSTIPFITKSINSSFRMAANTMAVQTLVIMLFVSLIAGGRCAIISTTGDEDEQAFGQSSDQPPTQFGRDILNAHNDYRRMHVNTRPLVWSSKAAQMAQDWANHIAIIGKLKHGNHKGMGQNVAGAYGSSPLTGSKATRIWYNEIDKYDYNNQSQRQPGTGHFTQVVWKGTKGLGCGIAISGKRSYVVCNYTPPGNIGGRYEENVKPLSVQPPTQFGRDILKAHNEYRRKHIDTHPLVWSTKAAQMAQDWANHLAKIDKLKHGNFIGMGQNLAGAIGSPPLTGSKTTRLWYDEIDKYDYNNQSQRQPGTGHFTQVVWKGTTGLGCGIAVSGKKSYVVCNYTPSGNVGGRYEENVKPLAQ